MNQALETVFRFRVSEASSVGFRASGIQNENGCRASRAD